MYDILGALGGLFLIGILVGPLALAIYVLNKMK
jgi:hypothetical protein